MAAALQWNAKTITAAGETVAENTQISVAQNVATLIRRDRSRESKPGVVSVTAVRGMPNQRVIAFDDGTEWVVNRKQGCGCR